MLDMKPLLGLLPLAACGSTSLTGELLSSSPSLQLSEDSEGAFTLSVSSINDELTIDTAVIRPYRSNTAYTFCTHPKPKQRVYSTIRVCGSAATRPTVPFTHTLKCVSDVKTNTEISRLQITDTQLSFKSKHN